MENDFKIEDCIIKATIPNGDIIEFPKKFMRYDSADDIFWYEDKALSDIEILDPNGNAQTKYKSFHNNL